MEQFNTRLGGGTRTHEQHNVTQVINNNYPSTPANDKVDIEGARYVNEKLKKVIDKLRKPARPPLKAVIDFKNDLAEGIESMIEMVPTEHLRFRKNNGRIIAEVESYEKENGVTLDEESKETQEILRRFLAGNDRERNDELKRLLTHKGQREPAIITCDGFLINGNRRKMALDELYMETGRDRFATMRVVILPDVVSELDIQKVENRYQLQSEGKSEYQGLNRAIKYKRNIENNFLLRDQLKDDPNYYSLSDSALNKVVKDYEKNYIRPLECIDQYLEHLGRSGMYNTITESSGDREGRWQAFVDYSHFYHTTIKPGKLAHLHEDDIGKLETAVFNMIRKRSLTRKGEESPEGKLHEFIRKLPKYLGNKEALSHILKIADVPSTIPEEMIQDKRGNKSTEREIDGKWGAHHEEKILQNVFLAQRCLNNQEIRDKPLDLLEDALKKLNHNNLQITNMGPEYYDKGLDLTERISNKTNEIHKAIDHARDNHTRSGKQD